MASLRFDERVAIVSGAGHGMGRSHAFALAARGASVVVNDTGANSQGDDRDAGLASRVAEEIRVAGGIAVATADDASTVDGAKAIVAAAIDSFGRVDIVVNSAGVATFGSFIDTDLQDFMKHLIVVLIGSFNVSRAAWPHMIEQRYGRIVMIASSALLGHSDVVSCSTARSGQVGLTKSLALGGAEYGIKVNAIAPADVRTLPDGETEPVAPENASAVVVLLSHESCPANGEIMGVGPGHIGRLFMADTLGYANGQVLVAEDVLGHWDKVIDEAGYFVPSADAVRRSVALDPAGALSRPGEV